MHEAFQQEYAYLQSQRRCLEDEPLTQVRIKWQEEECPSRYWYFLVMGMSSNLPIAFVFGLMPVFESTSPAYYFTPHAYLACTSGFLSFLVYYILLRRTAFTFRIMLSLIGMTALIVLVATLGLTKPNNIWAFLGILLAINQMAALGLLLQSTLAKIVTFYGPYYVAPLYGSLPIVVLIVALVGLLCSWLSMPPWSTAAIIAGLACLILVCSAAMHADTSESDHFKDCELTGDHYKQRFHVVNNIIAGYSVYTLFSLLLIEVAICATIFPVISIALRPASIAADTWTYTVIALGTLSMTLGTHTRSTWYFDCMADTSIWFPIAVAALNILLYLWINLKETDAIGWIAVLTAAAVWRAGYVVRRRLASVIELTDDHSLLFTINAAVHVGYVVGAMAAVGLLWINRIESKIVK